MSKNESDFYGYISPWDTQSLITDFITSKNIRG